MWHKAIWKGHPMRLELTRVGLLVELANHYTTRGTLDKLENAWVEVKHQQNSLNIRFNKHFFFLLLDFIPNLYGMHHSFVIELEIAPFFFYSPFYFIIKIFIREDICARVGCVYHMTVVFQATEVMLCITSRVESHRKMCYIVWFGNLGSVSSNWIITLQNKNKKKHLLCKRWRHSWS